MKNLTILLAFSFLLSSCSFTTSNSGMALNYEEDAEELVIAKKAIEYIEQDNLEDLKSLLDEKLVRLLNEKTIDEIFNLGQEVIENNTYPDDSEITVSHISVKSITGTKVSKEFAIPFENETNSDKSRIFKIRFTEGKIDKLMISTGMRFIKK